MANSLKKQTQGEAMNIPPGIDRISLNDDTVRYRVRIRIKGHKPISKNFKTLTHAKQWKRVTEGQIEKGLYVSFSKADQYTVAEAIRRYRKEILPLKTKDGHNVARHLNRWEKELGHLKLSKLNQSAIAEVRNRMLEEEIRPGKLRSNSTVSRYLASFSHALSIAVREWQWNNENPCLKVRKPKAPPGRIRYLSREEILNLSDACKKSSNKDLYLIFLIALTTGARKSEILGLTGECIDLENRLFLFHDTKNSESRSSAISDRVFNILKERPMESSTLLFPSPNDLNRPICIRSAWEKAIEKADIKEFKFHDLRHTAASHLTMGGATTREIAELLGHKTLQMVKRYSHLSSGHMKTLADKLDEIITEKT